MPKVLLVFEFLGTTELMVIALVALIIFGPRKLPEIGRTLGRSLAEFKRASDDFKRTWEYEVEMDQRKPALPDAPAPALADEVPSISTDEMTAGGNNEVSTSADTPHEAQTIARSSFASEWGHELEHEPNDAKTKGGASLHKDEDELNAS